MSERTSERVQETITARVSNHYLTALALLNAGLDPKAVSDMTTLSFEAVQALMDAARGEHAGAMIE